VLVVEAGLGGHLLVDVCLVVAAPLHSAKGPNEELCVEGEVGAVDFWK